MSIQVCEKYAKGKCDGKCGKLHTSLCQNPSCDVFSCEICKMLMFKYEKMQTFINLQKENGIDIMFCLDSTGSMGSYIELCKTYIIQIIEDVHKFLKDQCKLLDNKIKIGFICYRDKIERQKNEWTFCQLTSDIGHIKQLLEKEKAKGGGDTPEDVKAVLQYCLPKDNSVPSSESHKYVKWESALKYIVLITDAPAHGQAYHSLQKSQDDYFDEDMTEEIKKLCSNSINLISLQINKSLTQKMNNAFENLFKLYGGKFQQVDCNDLQQQLKDEQPNLQNSLKSMKIVEMFTAKISKPILEITNEGFTESKMPKDFLIANLKKEIITKKNEIKKTMDKGHTELEFTFYQVDVKKFDKSGLDIEYSSFAKQTFSMSDTVFSHGSLRDVYILTDNWDKVAEDFAKSKKYVLKTPKSNFGYTSFNEIIQEWKGNFIAQEMAKEFNLQLQKHGVYEVELQFNKILLGQKVDTDSTGTGETKQIQYFAIEEYLSYPYVKFNNNFGSIQNYPEEIPQQILTDDRDNSKLNLKEIYLKYQFLSQIAQCFTHWSFEGYSTKEYFMVVDLQGDLQTFTDPIILTYDGKDHIRMKIRDKNSEYVETCDTQPNVQNTNSNKLGIFAFFKNHVCNQLCKRLGLTNYNQIVKLTPEQLEFVEQFQSRVDHQNQQINKIQTIKENFAGTIVYLNFFNQHSLQSAFFSIPFVEKELAPRLIINNSLEVSMPKFIIFAANYESHDQFAKVLDDINALVNNSSYKKNDGLFSKISKLFIFIFSEKISEPEKDEDLLEGVGQWNLIKSLKGKLVTKYYQIVKNYNKYDLILNPNDDYLKENGAIRNQLEASTNGLIQQLKLIS